MCTIRDVEGETGEKRPKTGENISVKNSNLEMDSLIHNAFRCISTFNGHECNATLPVIMKLASGFGQVSPSSCLAG